MLFLAHNEAFAPSYPMFKPVPRPERSFVLAPRQSQFLDQSDAGALFRVANGCLALVHYLPDGRRQVLDILGPGRLFGATLCGLGNCIAESLTYSDVERVGQTTQPGQYAAELAAMLGRMQSHALLLGRKTAPERVATAVLDLARQFARPASRRIRSPQSFNLYPTRADLADWLGLTVETVSRSLNAFKRRELIAFSRPEQIAITDRLGLLQASGSAVPSAS